MLGVKEGSQFLAVYVSLLSRELIPWLGVIFVHFLFASLLFTHLFPCPNRKLLFTQTVSFERSKGKGNGKFDLL